MDGGHGTCLWLWRNQIPHNMGTEFSGELPQREAGGCLVISRLLVLQSHRIRSFQSVSPRGSENVPRSSRLAAKSVKLCRFINTTVDTLGEPRAQEPHSNDA